MTTKFAYTWIKLHVSLLDDTRLNKLSERALWRYVQAQLYIARDDTGGEFTRDGESLAIEDIAWALRVDEKILSDDFDELINVGFMVFEDETYAIKNWMEEQGPSDKAKRKQWRERQRRKRARDAEQPVTGDKEEIKTKIKDDNKSRGREEGHGDVTRDNHSHLVGEKHADSQSFSSVEALKAVWLDK